MSSTRGYTRDRDWNRSELYQTVAFAAAFRATQGVVVNFVPPGKQPPAPVQFGEITVSGVAWPAHKTLTTEAAIQQFSDNVRTWATQALGQPPANP